MSDVVDAHTPTPSRLRVFALTVALILITYALAGIQLESPARIQPLGIPFVVERPDLLAIGIVLASVYSTVRFVYFAMLVQPSPTRARRRLTRGSRVDTSTAPASLNEFHRQVSREIHRYFPRVGKTQVLFQISEVDNGYTIELTVPWLVRVVAGFEDVDFLAPVWANALALVLWIQFSFA